MGIKLSNNANATLAASITSSSTSITVTSGQGARFPTLSAGDYFYATLIDTSNNLEIVKCTARSTDVLTVVRAQESTTSRAYSTGDRIEIRLTAPTFVDAAGSFASGTALLFQQTSAPTGWTKSTTHNDKALRVVSGAASSGGSVAFTSAFTSQSGQWHCWNVWSNHFIYWADSKPLPPSTCNFFCRDIRIGIRWRGG